MSPEGVYEAYLEHIIFKANLPTEIFHLDAQKIRAQYLLQMRANPAHDCEDRELLRCPDALHEPLDHDCHLSGSEYADEACP